MIRDDTMLDNRVRRRVAPNQEDRRQRRLEFEQRAGRPHLCVGVMLFVEIPLVAMFVRPGGVTAGIERFHGWLRRKGWSLVAGLALIAGTSAIAQGIDALS
jgi:hypothetical protein